MTVLLPKVSVILPTRDRAALLPRALASVFAQSESDWELLVIDNNRRERPVGEQPNLAAWLSDSRLRVIADRTARNASMARNVGLGAARGRWITYLDDDDAYRPEKLARQLALAEGKAAALVLCGAEFHLRGRRRVVQSSHPLWRGDELLLRARWNTPLLLHRHPGGARFDESLSPGEDAEFAHRLVALAGAAEVHVVAEPLVDIHPQSGPRVNTNAAPVLGAAAKIMGLRPGFYSPRAQRRYLLQNELAVAKLAGNTRRCVALTCELLRESRGADWRACANALCVSLGWFEGRWVS